MRLSVSVILCVFCSATAVFADSFGPYHFRSGVEQTHMRFSISFRAIDGAYSIETCASFVMNKKLSSEEDCWESSAEILEESESRLVLNEGYETYEIDRVSESMDIFDSSSNSPFVSNLRPSLAPNWDFAPLSK